MQSNSAKLPSELKPDRTNQFMVQNVQYSNGWPSHMTLPFEYRTLILSGIQLSGIQMVTVYHIRGPKECVLKILPKQITVSVRIAKKWQIRFHLILTFL